jgi:protein TonB
VTLALPASRGEPVSSAAPDIVVAPEPAETSSVPAVLVPAPAPEAMAAPLPVVGADPSARGCPHPVAARISLSVIASFLLHAGAAAAFVWLSWTAPPPISAGEEGIPVELVVAAETGSSSRQEAASGRHESETPSADSQALQKVEAPPAETPPEPAVAEPVETAAEEPPVAQPDPVTTAERILDQLPPPPMPDTLPILEKPAEPVVAETPPPPPAETAAKIETPEPAEVQAALAPPVEPPPPPVVEPPPQVTPPPAPRAEQPPPVRREATRPPRTRRETPTTRETRRPTRQAAATPQRERSSRAARQAQARASVAERGEGAGQRNRQQSDATGTSGASTVAAVAAWRQRVLAHLARHKVYPEQARERGIRGRTGIAFTLTANGSVASVSIASSSGAAILDQATLAMVRRAQPFPPNPAGGSASFTAGINYSLY